MSTTEDPFWIAEARPFIDSIFSNINARYYMADFSRALYEYISCLPDAILICDEDKFCILVQIATYTSINHMITYTDVIQLLRRFGPVRQCIQKMSILYDENTRAPHKWWWGPVERETCYTLMMENIQTDPLAYKAIMRFGRLSTINHNFSMSVINNSDDPVNIVSYIVTNTPMGYKLQMDGSNDIYPTIAHILLYVYNIMQWEYLAANVYSLVTNWNHIYSVR
jgi:hypothetical protein